MVRSKSSDSSATIIADVDLADSRTIVQESFRPATVLVYKDSAECLPPLLNSKLTYGLTAEFAELQRRLDTSVLGQR